MIEVEWGCFGLRAGGPVVSIAPSVLDSSHDIFASVPPAVHEALREDS